MCEDCGCGQPGPTRIGGQPAANLKSPLLDETPMENGVTAAHAHDHAHGHSHDHDSGHGHSHDPAEGHSHSHTHREVGVYQPILAANDRMAERNRGFFRALDLLTLNIVSSPGSGKTTLVQKTLQKLGEKLRSAVIVGDLETENDANRLRAAGAKAVQITTGTMCHLEADMIARALSALDPKSLDLLIVENVGNLVCPASFDLGEDLRVVLHATTEGEDKPLKYPPIFHSAQVVIVNKIDLAEVVEFDREQAIRNIRKVNPKCRIFELSAKTGEGVDAWCEFLLERHAQLARG